MVSKIIKVKNGNVKHILVNNISYLEEIDVSETQFDLNIVCNSNIITLSFTTKELRDETISNITNQL